MTTPLNQSSRRKNLPTGILSRKISFVQGTPVRRSLRESHEPVRVYSVEWEGRCRIVTGPSVALQANVLALNRAYVAIQAVPARRAFAMLWKGMAEVISVENGSYLTYDFAAWLEVSELRIEIGEVDDHEDWVRAVNFTIQVPRVIRLLTNDRFPNNLVKFSRRNIFLRDENCCQYCGRRFNQHDLSLDHVVPRSRGGETSWENIVAACLKCNVRKGGRTPQEARMNLRNEPVRPKRSPVLSHQIDSQKYACWKNFVR